MNPLVLTLRATPTGPVLQIDGDLDYATAPTLRERLQALDLQPGQRLVLDLSGLRFCDSSGITAMIAAHNHTATADAGFALANVPARTLSVLRTVGLDQIFPVLPASGTPDVL
ncbi:STAS domain-containing protein [Streptomyces sp. NPDC001691]|uniref:STAS domain-containing protein n=1 Tax=unclassified Streptomyces TaxID=2593676 RepID=UPI000DE84C15|nr:STAS domain-containing protein [Streptomyces sp. SDr-06]RCH64968.1 anti-sigma factor antagonist [Streptomyces sp. SDr-06]